jgi:hypothetical protein
LATGGPADCQSAKQQVANLRYVEVTGQGQGEGGPFLPTTMKSCARRTSGVCKTLDMDMGLGYFA